MKYLPLVSLTLLVASAVFGAEPNPLNAPLAKERPLYLDLDAALDDRVADLVGRLSLEEKAIALNHNGPDIQRIGLRGDKWNQCLNGVQWDRPTTLFPTCIAMAATWDPGFLQSEIARVLSDEARAIYNGWQENDALTSQHKGLIYRDPVINIGRNPYWGRNHEAFGEDPLLTGLMGQAYVRGIQGDHPKYLKLAATLKHYAVNNVETDRFRLDAAVSKRMLHEYWLPHFRRAVVAGDASSLMASYNAINGTPNNINHWLLTDVLKKRWGHTGFVVSDLGGVRTMVEGHGRNRMNYVDAVAQSLMAGCDFSDAEFQEHIPAAVREGKLSEERLDDALTRVLRIRFRLGEFDPPEQNPYSKISPDVIASRQHRDVALQAAQKSIVLLQNRNDALPLDVATLKKVAVIGPLADRVVLNNYNGRHTDLVTPLRGISQRLGDSVEVLYAPGGGVGGRGDRLPTQVDREAGMSDGRSLKLDASAVGDYIEFPVRVQKAGEYSVALQYKTFPSRGRFQLSVDGESLGEPLDMYESSGSYGKTQAFGTSRLAAGTHRFRFTVVGQNRNSQGFTGHFDKLTVQGDSAIEVELERSRFDTGRSVTWKDPIGEAVAAAQQADVAIVFVGTDQTIEQEGRDRRSLGLPGDQLPLVQRVAAANPKTVVVLKSAGPLTVPWVKDNVDAVLQAWWGGEEDGTAIANVLAGDVSPAGRLPHTVYVSEEQVPSLDEYNIDAGFTYMYVRGAPLYPFGHGLSYTRFGYSNLQVPDQPIESHGEFSIGIDVQNVGAVSSDEVVQVYFRAVDSQISRPKIKLCGFRRLHLDSNQKQTVRITIPTSELAYFDEDQDAFVVEPGQYEILVGSSSADIRQHGVITIAGSRR